MKLYTTLLLLLIALYVSGQDKASCKIYNAATKQQITLPELAAAMDKANILFYGEEHDDSVGHVIEFELFKGLTVQYPGKAALSMEMFETDVQMVLNEYLQGFIREKNFIAEARAWPSYKTDYRPLIELAKTNGIPVVAANAPARYVNMVSNGGLNNLNRLSKTAVSYLPPLPIDTAAGAYYEKFVSTMGGHAAMGGKQIYQSQNLWDATMAWSIARFYKKHKNYKILQINGGFHSEEKMGIVSQLKHYAPKARIITINAYADNDPNNPDWTTYQNKADYIILTASK